MTTTSKTPTVPIRKVDSAVRYVERWATPVERAELSAAIEIEDKRQSRAAIAAVAEKVKERRRQEPKRTRFNRHQFSNNQYVGRPNANQRKQS